MEEIMRTFSLTELLYLTRRELLDLHTRIVAHMASLPEASADRATAWFNLRLIRSVLTRHGPAP